MFKENTVCMVWLVTPLPFSTRSRENSSIKLAAVFMSLGFAFEITHSLR